MGDAVGAESRRGLVAGAIGFGGDFIASLASSGPTAGVAFTLPVFVAVSGLGSPLVILTAGVIVLLVAIGYARLNRWRADAGAPYIWVGRVISPALGFATGLLALGIGFLLSVGGFTLAASYLLAILSPGTVFPGVVIWLVSAAFSAALVFLAVRGIRLSVRVQTVILGAEYLVLLSFALLALIREGNHVVGTTAPSLSYFSFPASSSGWTAFAMALVIGGFLFGGWEAPFLFSEESKKPNFNPGRAAIVGVVAATVWYLVLFSSFQGVASAKDIGDNGADVLGYVSTLLAPQPWARLLPLAVFSAIFAAAQIQVSEASRVMFAMGQDRVLPGIFARLHPRFRTPWVGVLVFGGLPLVVLIAYLVSSSATTVIGNIVGSTGLLYLAMYTLIPLASVIFAVRALKGQRDMLSSLVPPLIGGLAMLGLFVYGLSTQPSAVQIVVVIVLVFCLGAGIIMSRASKAEYFKATEFNPADAVQPLGIAGQD